MGRKKENWLSLIEFNDLVNDFEFYRLKHSEISLNRCARAFCLKKGLLKTPVKKHLDLIQACSIEIDTSEIGDVVYGQPNLNGFKNVF